MNAGWRSFRLGDPDVASITLGQSPPSETYNDSRDGLPFFQGKADFGSHSPRARLWCSAPLRVAEPNDILISVRAPVGDVNIADQRCSIGRGLAAIRSLRLDSEFLYYALIHAKPLLEAEGTGSTFDSINRYTLENFEITAPSDIDEQRAIARTLRAAQTAAEIEARTVVTLAALKSATMAKLFREGMRGEPLKQTEIGEFPQSWDVVRLGDHCQLKSGGTPSRQYPEYWGGDIPWVKTTEINYREITGTEEKITQIGLDDSSAKIFDKGTVVMAMYGQGVTRGRVAILGIRAATNQACAAFFPDATISPRFLYAYFTHAYKAVRQFGHGANQQNLSLELLRNVTLPVPPSLEEQDEIFQAVSNIQWRIEISEARAAAVTQLFTATLNALMTGGIRVKNLARAEVTNA